MSLDKHWKLAVCAVFTSAALLFPIPIYAQEVLRANNGIIGLKLDKESSTFKVLQVFDNSSAKSLVKITVMRAGRPMEFTLTRELEGDRTAKQLGSSKMWTSRDPDIPDLPPSANVRPKNLEPKAINWQSDLKTALLSARESKKKVLLYMVANGCGSTSGVAYKALDNPDVIQFLNRNFICVQNDWCSNAPVDSWARQKYGLGYGADHLVVIEPDGKKAARINDIGTGLMDELYRASIDWNIADHFAKEGDVDALKKFLTKIVHNKYCNSSFAIFQLKDPERDRQWYSVRYEKGLGSFNLYDNKAAYLRMKDVPGEIIRRNFKNIAIAPAKSKKRVEVRELEFLSLSPNETCTISGIALNSDGTPAKNAQIIVDTNSYARCNDEGKFEVTGLSAGRHSLHFQSLSTGSRNESTQDFELEKGKTQPAQINLKTAR